MEDYSDEFEGAVDEDDRYSSDGFVNVSGHEGLATRESSESVADSIAVASDLSAGAKGRARDPLRRRSVASSVPDTASVADSIADSAGRGSKAPSDAVASDTVSVVQSAADGYSSVAGSVLQSVVESGTAQGSVATDSVAGSRAGSAQGYVTDSVQGAVDSEAVWPPSQALRTVRRASGHCFVGNRPPPPPPPPGGGVGQRRNKRLCVSKNRPRISGRFNKFHFVPEDNSSDVGGGGRRGRLWTACGRRCVDSKNSQTTPATTSTAPTQTTGLRERGNNTSGSTGRSGRQNAATRRNMRREERVTVQGPVKKQRPDGMSHRGSVGRGWPGPQTPPSPPGGGSLSNGLRCMSEGGGGH